MIKVITYEGCMQLPWLQHNAPTWALPTNIPYPVNWQSSNCSAFQTANICNLHVCFDGGACLWWIGKCYDFRKCRVLFMPDCLSLVWGHSVHFAEFPTLQFSKCCSFYSSHQISTKLQSIIIRGRANKALSYYHDYVFGNLWKITTVLTLWNYS